MRHFAAIVAASAAFFMSACANDNAMLKAQADATAAQAQARVAEAQARAEEAKAVQALAPKVDAGGAAAYLIAKAMGQHKSEPGSGSVQVQQPQSLLGLAWQSLLQVADVGLRAYGIKVAGDVAMNNSNNARETSVASYGAFTSMGQSIAQAGTAGYPYVQAPQANVTTTLSGTGVIGSGSFSAPITTTTNRNCSGGTGASGGAGAGAVPGGAGGTANGGNC